MGTVHRFPLEEVDYFRSTDFGRNAVILVLPVVKVERYEPLLCEGDYPVLDLWGRRFYSRNRQAGLLAFLFFWILILSSSAFAECVCLGIPFKPLPGSSFVFKSIYINNYDTDTDVKSSRLGFFILRNRKVPDEFFSLLDCSRVQNETHLFDLRSHIDAIPRGRMPFWAANYTKGFHQPCCWQNASIFQSILYVDFPKVFPTNDSGMGHRDSSPESIFKIPLGNLSRDFGGISGTFRHSQGSLHIDGLNFGSANKSVGRFVESVSENSDGGRGDSTNTNRIYDVSNVPESDIQKVMRGASLVFCILIGFAYLVVRRWL